MRMPKIAALVAAAVLSAAACASGANNTQSGASSAPGASSTTQFQKKEPLKIGYSTYDLQQPYWQSYTAGIKDAAAKQKIEVVVADQKSSQQNQVSGSADLINQGISALIISPVQPPALPATVAAAHTAKIPVIVADIGAQGDYDAFILSDNRHGGELAANYVVDSLGKQPGPHQVGVIELHSGSAVGDDRVNGFKDTLAKNKDFTVVSSISGNDTVDGGFKAAQDMLSANPNLAAIYAANDPEAEGAARALEAAGKTVANGFVLVGFNGDAPALDLIGSGKQSATIAQDPYGQGQLAVDTAMKLLNGQKPDFADPAKRTLLFPVEVVTAKNLADFRASRQGQQQPQK